MTRLLLLERISESSIFFVLTSRMSVSGSRDRGEVQRRTSPWGIEGHAALMDLELQGWGEFLQMELKRVSEEEEGTECGRQLLNAGAGLGT